MTTKRVTNEEKQQRHEWALTRKGYAVTRPTTTGADQYLNRLVIICLPKTSPFSFL